MKKIKSNFIQRMSFIIALVLLMETILTGFSSFIPMHTVAAQGEQNKLEITDFTGKESKFKFPVDSEHGNKASIVNNTLVLTPAQPMQFGTAMTKDPLLLPNDKSFSTNFSFSVSDMGKYSEWVNKAGGDSMFYVLQSESTTPVWSDKKRDGTEKETSDGDKGVYITNGLMLEFRTYSNNNPTLDGGSGTIPSFIRIWSGKTLLKEIEYKQGYFDSMSDKEKLNNVWLDYDGTEKKLSLYFKQDNDIKPTEPIWTGSSDLSNGFTSNNLYGSMSAWQGHAYEKHTILSWGIEPTVKKSEDTGQVATFEQVGPSKIFQSQSSKFLTILGKGFKSSEDDFKFIIKKRSSESGVEISPNKVVINSDKEIRMELPTSIDDGLYDLMVEQKSNQVKKFENAFEVTNNQKYKSRKYSEISYNPKKLTTQEVNKVVFKGPFEEKDGKYILSDANETVTINGFLMFKGTQLNIDTSGVVTGNGRLYVNGRSKNGISTTYTLHEGAFTIDDQLQIILTESGTYDFLKLNMPVGIKSMKFTKNGLKATGDINSKLKLGITDIENKTSIDNLEISPNGVHLDQKITMPGTLNLGPLKASELIVDIDTKKDKYGFSASAGISDLVEGFELDLMMVRGQLDTIKFAVENPVPIGSTGTQFTELGGGMKGLSKGAKLPMTFSMLGDLSDTVTPEMFGNNMINAKDIKVGISRSHVEVNGRLAIYTLNIADVESKVVFNPIGYPGFNKAGFKLDARIDILGIVLGKFNVQYFQGESFKGYLNANVIVPKSVPLIGGKSLTKATLGVDETKVRGSLSLIGVGFVTSYTFKNGKVDFKVDALATLKNVGKIAVGAVKFIGKNVGKAFKSIGKVATKVSKGIKKTASKVKKALKKGIKKAFKKLKFWSAPVYFSNGDFVNPENDFALIEALQSSTEEVDVVQITAEDTERMLIEITNVSNKDILHVLAETEIYNLNFDSSTDDWNAVYREEEKKVYFFVDLNKGESIDIASEDNSIQVDNVESYGINSDSKMQQIIDEYIVSGQEIPFTVEEVSNLALAVKHTTDELQIIRPNGEEYVLDFNWDSANWNASYSKDSEQVIIKIPNAETGDWKVFISGGNEKSDVDFFDIKADDLMSEDLINPREIMTFELDKQEQVYIQVKNASRSARLLQPDDSEYTLNFDKSSESFNAFFDENTEVLHLLVNADQTGYWGIDNEKLVDAEVYTLEERMSNLKPLFGEEANQQVETYFNIDKPGRYLFEITNGDTTAEIIRPDESTIEKILDENDLNQNSSYQEDQNRMYIKVDVDSTQLGEYIVKTNGLTETIVTQVNPLPEITSFNATKDDGLNTYDFAWNIENPREGSEVQLMLTTSKEEPVGMKLAGKLDSNGTRKVTIPRSIMSGEYYVSLETNHEDIGPKFKVLETPITVSWPDAPSAPKDLSVISTANGQITLGFKDTDFQDKSFYRVLEKKEEKVDYFGSNHEVEVNKSSENQQIILGGLKTNETYKFVIVSGVEDDNKPGISLPSEEIEVYLPEPTPPEVTIAIETEEGAKKKTFTEIVDDTWEDITTLINKKEATVKVNVNEESTIEVYVNDELKKTVKGTMVEYKMNDLNDRDYFIDVRVKNGRGDQNRVFQTLYVDTQAPMLQMNNEQFSIIDTEEGLVISGQTDTGAMLVIDGEEVLTDDNGNFTHDYQHKGGDGGAEINIVATDSVGNTTEHMIELLLGDNLINQLGDVLSVTVTPAESIIVQGASGQLKADVEVTGKASKAVNWRSSDNNGKVKVDEAGKVTVAQDAEPGIYTITAISTFNTSKKGTAEVTVQAKDSGGNDGNQVKYKIIFNTNGGSTVGSIEDVVTESTVTSPTSPTKSGYTFQGWYKEDTLTNKWNFSTDKVRSDTTLFAKWKKISSNSGGGGGGTTPSIPGNNEDSSTTVVVPSKPTDSLDKPTEAIITVKTDKENVTIPQKTVADAISKAKEEAKKNNTQENGVSIEVKIDNKNNGSNGLSANLPKLTVDELSKEEVKEFKVTSDVATISLDLETIKTIQKEINTDVNLSAKKVDNKTLSEQSKVVVGNRPVFDITLTGTNGKKVSKFGKGKVLVAIPYTLDEGEKVENIVAYYISNDGKIEQMPNSAYDETTKTVRFFTNHFSKFAVGYNIKKFDLQADVELNKVWTIKFNKIVDEDSVNENSIYIQDEAGNKVSLDRKVEDNKVILTPKDNYKPATKYTIHVTDGVESNKNILKPYILKSFETVK